MPREHGEEFSFTNMTLFSLKTNLGFNHSGRWKETVIKIKGISLRITVRSYRLFSHKSEDEKDLL